MGKIIRAEKSYWVCLACLSVNGSNISKKGGLGAINYLKVLYHALEISKLSNIKWPGQWSMDPTNRGGSRMRGAPGTLVFAHLHPQPHPEVRGCATNIFTGSDIVAATIFRFVKCCCHQYTSSTCVTSCLSSEIWYYHTMRLKI